MSKLESYGIAFVVFYNNDDHIIACVVDNHDDLDTIMDDLKRLGYKSSYYIETTIMKSEPNDV